MNEQEKLACKNCPFWDEEPESSVREGYEPDGRCRRHAPRPGGDATMWRTTTGVDWCGDHPSAVGMMAGSMLGQLAPLIALMTSSSSGVPQ